MSATRPSPAPAGGRRLLRPTSALRSPAAWVGLAVLLVSLANRSSSGDVAVEVSERVSAWPDWAHALVELVSELGLVALAATLLLAALSARRRGTTALARALLGGAGTVAAYGLSELLKLLSGQERPCSALPGVRALVECPGAGDWSLPSNHATLAAGLATAVLLVAPRLWAWVVPLALSVAAARVGLGVHYPHDVVDGALLGTAVVLVVVLLGQRAVARALPALCRGPLRRLLPDPAGDASSRPDGEAGSVRR